MALSRFSISTATVCSTGTRAKRCRPSQFQAIYIDYNGDLPGTATPNYPPDVDAPTRGLRDFSSLAPYVIWSPGERFRDLNEDGQYDALLEPTRDGWMDADCIPDGIIEDNEFCDLDDDGEWDFPEPFEDFLIIYVADATSADGRWVKLDPSAKNEDCC